MWSVLVVLLLPPVVRLSFFLGSCLACVAFAPPSWASGPQVYVCCCHPVQVRAAEPLVHLCCCRWLARARAVSGVLPVSLPLPGCRCSHSPCPCPALHWLGQRTSSCRSSLSVVCIGPTGPAAVPFVAGCRVPSTSAAACSPPPKWVALRLRPGLA